MKNGKTNHYQRIHASVAHRLWSDLPVKTREVIANDNLHLSQELNWFTTKVNNDTQRIYEDEHNHVNSKDSFTYPKYEAPEPRVFGDNVIA